MTRISRDLFLWTVALVLTIGIAVASARITHPFTTRVVRVDRGKSIFADRCSSCHSIMKGKQGFGPSLFGLTHSNRKRRTSTQSPTEYIYESIIDPGAFKATESFGGMPQGVSNGLTHDQLIDLVAYVSSFDREIDYEALAVLPRRQDTQRKQPVVNWSLDKLEHGKKLFFGELGCAKCHSVDDQPSFIAPNLRSIGLEDSPKIKRAILDPSHEIAIGFETWQLIHDGIPYSGRKLHSNEGQVRLLVIDSSTGNYVVRQFDEDKLEPLNNGKRIQKLDISPMPSYKGKMSPTELHSLLEFMSSLR